MSLVDDRGRLFGRVNLIDAAIGVFVLLLIPLAFGAYVLFRPPQPTITSVVPAQVEQGPEKRVTLNGTDFRPFMLAALGNMRGIRLLVQSPELAELVLPEVPPGVYDVVLYDNSNEIARVPSGVTVVGPPPPLESQVEVTVSGAFRSVPDPVASTLSTGNAFPAGATHPTAEVIALHAPIRETVFLATATGVLERPVPGRMRVPAVLRLRCEPNGTECQINSVSVGTGAMLQLPGVPGTFEVFDITADGKTPLVDSSPTRAVVDVEVRFATSPETFPLLVAGATDTDRRLFAPKAPRPGAVLSVFRKESDVSSISSVDWGNQDVWGAMPVLGLPRPMVMLTATLKVPVDRTPNGWIYKGSVVKLGAPMTFEGPLYLLRGWILGVRVRP
jgi:hypothetical protein